MPFRPNSSSCICNNIRGGRVDRSEETVLERLPRGAGWRLSGNSRLGPSSSPGPTSDKNQVITRRQEREKKSISSHLVCHRVCASCNQLRPLRLTPILLDGHIAVWQLTGSLILLG